MSPADAEAIAERERISQGIPPAAEHCAPESRWIEVGTCDAAGQWFARDVLVWVNRFTLPGAWIDLLIADATGSVVRVDKSRGYVLRHDRPARERA